MKGLPVSFVGLSLVLTFNFVAVIICLPNAIVYCSFMQRKYRLDHTPQLRARSAWQNSKRKKPHISVTVVSNGPDANAGSVLMFLSKDQAAE